MDWQRAMMVIDRFYRQSTELLGELEKTRSDIETMEMEGEWAAATRSKQSARRLVDQLISDLEKVSAIRGQLDIKDQSRFDEKTGPINDRIRMALQKLQTCCVLSPRTSRPLSDHSLGQLSDHSIGQLSSTSTVEKKTQVTISKEAETMRLRAEEAKMDAEASQMLAKDVEDLSQIMMDLGNLVHAQHDMVDSIEEHCEQAEREVKAGQRDLRKAVAANSAKYPMAAAVVGGVAIGGPAGLAAGSAIAGLIAAAGGAIAGFYGGNMFKRHVKNEAKGTSQSSSN